MSDKVSIILPVYNGEKYLHECLNSLLNQTYRNFEIIIIDDCSTDHSAEIIQSYDNSKIYYYRNNNNQGIVYSLNRAISLSRGKYIARMDADDICAPERLEKQVAFLDQHPNIGLISTWFRIFDGKEGICCYPTDPEELKCRLLFSLQLLHPGWMFRRELIEKYNLHYREEYKYAEDWDFLVRATAVTQLSNVPEILMNYRINATQISSVFNSPQKQIADLITKNQLAALGIFLTEEEFQLYRVNTGRRENLLTKKEMCTLISILKQLESANNVKCIYDAKILHRVLQEDLHHLCYYNLIHKNLSGLQLYGSGYFLNLKIGILNHCKFLLRGLWACIPRRTSLK